MTTIVPLTFAMEGEKENTHKFSNMNIEFVLHLLSEHLHAF